MGIYKKSFFLIFMFYLCSTIFADDGSGSVNYSIGQAQYNNSDEIKMKDEVVYIDTQFITTIFTFENQSSKNQSVTFLFPVLGEYSPDRFDNELYKNEYDMIEDKYFFQTYVNGVKFERKLIKTVESPSNKGYPWSFVLDYEIKKGETIKIVNIFRNNAKKAYSSSNGSNSITYEYVLKTGSTWKGSIENIKIYWQYNYSKKGKENYYEYRYTSGGSDSVEVRVYHVGYEWTVPWDHIELIDDRMWYVWEYSNIKPDFNIGYTKHQVYEETIELDQLILNSKFIITKENAERFIVFAEEVLKDCWEKIYYRKDKRFLNFIQYCVNVSYALDGYDFKNQNLKQFFSQFNWYQPRSPYTETSELNKRNYFLLYNKYKIEK